MFAELGRDDGAQDRREDGTSELLAWKDEGLPAAPAIRSSEEAPQARVPRRSRLQRFERELDEWFSELAAVVEEETGQ